MKIFTIVSAKHGTYDVLLDDIDMELIIKLGGKWCVCKKRGRFYVQKRINKHIIEIHRFILNPKVGEYVDHINGNPLDNTRKNLRICTNAANLRNGRVRSNNKTGFNGVTWDRFRNKWHAKIKVNYKDIFLGRFKNFDDAIKARKDAEKKYWSI